MRALVAFSASRLLAAFGLILALGHLDAAESTKIQRSIPLFFHGGILACTGTVDGTSGVLIVDSGSNTTCLFARQAKSRRYQYAAVRSTCFTAGGTREVTSAVKSARFVVGDLTYTAKNLMILPDPPKSAQGRIIGLLGCDFLAQKHMLIDLARMRLAPQR